MTVRKTNRGGDGLPFGRPILDHAEPAIGARTHAPANRLGVAATIRPGGSYTVADNALTLPADDLPPFAFGMFSCGQESAAIHFEPGLLGVREPLVRILPVVQADAAGRAFTATDLNSTDITSS